MWKPEFKIALCLQINVETGLCRYRVTAWEHRVQLANKKKSELGGSVVEFKARDLMSRVRILPESKLSNDELIRAVGVNPRFQVWD